MVRAAQGASTCVEFVGSEPAYDDSKFIPVPISKGRSTSGKGNTTVFQQLYFPYVTLSTRDWNKAVWVFLATRWAHCHPWRGRP